MPMRPEPGTIGALPSTTLVAVPEPDVVVRLVNEGPTPFSMKYLTDIYEFQPGESEIVQWGVMVALLGNPYAVNTPRSRERDLAFKQLRMKYGAYDNADDWEANRPHLAAYSVRDGSRIVTIVDDPQGLEFAARSTSPDNTTEALRHQVNAMAQQVTELQRVIAERDGVTVHEAPVGTPPLPGTPGGPGAVQMTPPVAGSGGSAFVAPAPPSAPQVFDAPPPGAVPIIGGPGSQVDEATVDEPGMQVAP